LPTITANQTVKYVFLALNSIFSYISQWVALDCTAGYYAIALTDIHEGEELTFDYGPEYFEDEVGCPCSAHKDAKSPYLVSRFFFRGFSPFP
jgi:hypothetical protein